jgi:copper chaperone
MLKGIFAGLLIFSSVALADTKSYNVTGMTCESCVKSVKSKVCGLKDVEKCEVEVGKVTLTSKGTLNDKTVSEAIAAAGFKVAEAGAMAKEEGHTCDHQDGKSCGGEGCGCAKDGKECGCDHKNGKCTCKHDGKHKGHKHDKKKKG